jgi:CHAT domain-containing protein/tetratricopeptide (TPR) repeat protein
MPFAFRLWLPSLALSLSLMSPLFVRVQSSPSTLNASQSSAETEVRAVVERYFARYAAKDLDGLMSLWSAQSPDSASLKQNWQRQFTTEDYRFSPPMISRLKVEGEQASLRATVHLTAIDLKSQQPREQQMVRNFAFIREGEQWKVWRSAPAENDLAEALARATEESEQERLLREEKDLVDSSLLAALKQLTDPLFEKGDYAQALRMSQLAARIAERIGDRRGLGQALSDLGAAYLRQDRPAQALEYWQKSLVICEETGDKETLARVLHNLGYRYYLQNRTDQALQFYYRGLALSEELGDKPLTIQFSIKLGSAHRSQGRYEMALEFHQKSRALSEALGDKANVALSLNNLGDLYISQGRYAQALECLQKSVKINEELGSAADKETIAVQLNNIGLVYRRQGRPDQALEYYRQSLKLLEEINDRIRIGESQNNIGVVCKSQGLYEQALEWFQKSLKLFEEEDVKGNAAMSLNNIGDTYRRQGRYQLALEHLQQSLRLREELGNRVGIARTLNNLSLLYQDQGKYAEMLAVSRRAARLAEEINAPEDLWAAQDGVGRALRALGQPGAARQSFLAAISTIESLRHQVAGGGQQQQSFLENKLSPWLGLIALLVSQKESAEALSFAERSKARVLLDVLQAGRPSLRKSLSPQEHQTEEERRLRLVALNSQLTSELRRKEPDPSRVSELKAGLAKARLEYEALETNLYVAHPELKVQRGEASIIKAEDLTALLPDAASALLEYVVTDDQTYLFAITKAASKVEAEVRVYTLPIKRAELTKQIEAFREQLAGRDLGFRAAALKLSALLLKPAQAQLQGKTKLLIVPDDKLWELPFQALLASANRFLIEEAAIAYTPSLTVLREMTKRRKQQHAEAAPATLLALGNPLLGQETIERARLALRDEKLDPLPEAEQEAKALGQLYGAPRSRVYIGPEAREDRVKAEAGGASLLHFATHGTLNNAAPMYSHLVLAQGDTNEDGLLEAWELMQLDLKAELAVLSACETARGRYGAGEGVIGLTWALFVAGVPSTVVSQWKVESASTRDLMLSFHRHLRAPRAAARAQVTKAEALRQAALQVMKNPATSHPFYWAGFVLVGDGR